MTDDDEEAAEFFGPHIEEEDHEEHPAISSIIQRADKRVRFRPAEMVAVPSWKEETRAMN